jgi:ABC-type bacteriocin/lantibiotic exporter with double-glycine peptidase domain
MDIGRAGWLVNKQRVANTASGAVPQFAQNGSDVFLPLPQGGYEHQQHINMCGEACVVMLYRYHGDDANIDMSRNPRGVLKGGSVQKLLGRYAKLADEERRCKNFDRDSLAYVLRTFGPVIASGDFARFMGGRWGHFILVHGVVGNVVHIADPWHGEDREKPFAWFVTKLETFNYETGTKNAKGKPDYEEKYRFLYYTKASTATI